MSTGDERNGIIKNGVWAVPLFQNTRKSSQQNVLRKIVLQTDNSEADTLEVEMEITGRMFCLREIVKRNIRIIGFLGLIIGLLSSSICSYKMWMTSWYEEQISKGLILENNSMMFEFWKEPPIKPVISVYVFNYTNIDQVLTDKEKPIVREVGPYSFRETMERVNIKFYPNGTVSYQEKRSHEFIRELSSNDLQDTIITPNLPLMTAVAFSKSSYFWTRIGLNAILNSLEMKPFRVVTAKEFIWGYNDSFTNIASKVAGIMNRRIPGGLGVLSARIGVSPDVITIHNGANGFHKYGIISRFNGQSKLDAWNPHSECNRLDAGDGTLYPPQLLRSNDPLYVYAKEFCRRMPLTFHSHVKTEDGFPAVRYTNPRDIFSSPEINPNNSCFCVNSECAPDGLQSTQPCLYGAPFFISMPHFLSVDPEIQRDIIGLTPDPSKHATYIDIHEVLGIPIAGVSRLQMNIRVTKPPNFTPLHQLNDGTFLPIAWIQCKIGKLPPNLYTVVFHISFSLKLLEYLLKLLSVTAMLFSLFIIMKRVLDCPRYKVWIWL